MDKLHSIKRACEINDIIFSEIVSNFGFKTEKDIDIYIKKRFHDFHVKQAYPPIVANNSSIIHAKPRKKRLEKGFLVLDFASKVNNYCSDMTRTIFLGRASASDKRLYNLILSCQEKCIKKVRPGASCSNLDAYARGLIGTYSKFFKHSLGHGLSHQIHADPRLKAGSPHIIKKGDCITIEPGIYIRRKHKSLGIRIEDTLCVSDKPVILSKSPKKLIEINLK